MCLVIFILLNDVALFVGILFLRQESGGKRGVFPKISAEESPPLPGLRLHLRNERFGGDIITVLQASVCGPSVIFDPGRFLGSSQYHRLLEVVGYLFGSYLLDDVVDIVVESISVFLFKKVNTNM